MNLEISDELRARLREATTPADYTVLLESVSDDDLAAVAVLHMYAITVEDPGEKLRLNESALRRAERVGDGFPEPLKASLLANIGWSHLELGDRDAAKQWYLQAANAASALDDDEYGRTIRAGVDGVLASLD